MFGPLVAFSLSSSAEPHSSLVSSEFLICTGDDYLDQIKRTIAILGTPTQEDMAFIGNELAKKYVRSLPKRNKQNWSTLYQKSNPVALDLLGKMLVFNPEKRYTVKQCLKHPYFEGLHNEAAEPEAEEPFDWSWDDFEPTKDLLQKMVFQESLDFHTANEDDDDQ